MGDKKKEDPPEKKTDVRPAKRQPGWQQDPNTPKKEDK